jgi:hypothetical protein
MFINKHNGSKIMTDRQVRWHRRLSGLDSGSPTEPLVLDETMIIQWLQEQRAEYNLLNNNGR